MKFLMMLLDAAPAAGAQQGGGWQMIIMLGLVFVVMWLFFIRPQNKQRKEMEEFRNSLKKGDKIVTIGGIFGRIAEVGDNWFMIEVDKDVKIKVSKQAVQKDFTDAPAN